MLLTQGGSFPEKQLASLPQTKKSKSEIWRAVWHVSSISLTGIIQYQLGRGLWQQGLIVSALLLSIIYDRLRPCNAWVMKKSVKLLRPEELTGRTAGTDFIVGFYLAFLISHPEEMLISCLVMSICDPLARLVGVKLGMTKLPKLYVFDEKKSWVGSFTCCASAVLVALGGFTYLGFHGWPYVLGALAVGLTAAVTEALKRKKIWGIKTPADNCWLIIVTTSMVALIL